MLWFLIFMGIGIIGLIVLICYAIWLFHKVSDVFSELTMLAKRTEELSELLSQIKMPDSASTNLGSN